MLCSKHICLYAKQYQAHCRPGQIGWQLRRDGTANSNPAEMLGLNQSDNVPLREQAYPNRSIFKPLLQKAAISDTVTSSQDSICGSNLTETVEWQDVPLPPSPGLSQEKWRDFNEICSPKISKQSNQHTVHSSNGTTIATAVHTLCSDLSGSGVIVSQTTCGSRISKRERGSNSSVSVRNGWD